MASEFVKVKGKLAHYTKTMSVNISQIKTIRSLEFIDDSAQYTHVDRKSSKGTKVYNSPTKRTSRSTRINDCDTYQHQ
jgi:hypothetical protein